MAILRSRLVVALAVSLVVGLFSFVFFFCAAFDVSAGHTNRGIFYGFAKSFLGSGGAMPLRIFASVDKASGKNAKDVSIKARAGRHPVEWNFTWGAANVKARWEAWDRAEGWSASPRPGIDFSNATAWPRVVGREGGWRLGLTKPRIVVLTMPDRYPRRHQFHRSFQDLCLDASVTWAPALIGSRIPADLKWMWGRIDTKSFDHDKPGMWGVYASHLAILRDSHSECSDCDVIVFEDDVVFADEFRRRWVEFFTSLPSDWEILRLGGQGLWTPPLKFTEHHIRAVAVSNTWGYVVRARSVNVLANRLASLPIRGSWGIDAVFQLFHEELPTYVPVVPLIYAASSCHDTADDPHHKANCETPRSLARSRANVYARWPQGWIRTYCRGKGAVDNGNREKPMCKDVTSALCCPYLDPPSIPMIGGRQC